MAMLIVAGGHRDTRPLPRGMRCGLRPLSCSAPLCHHRSDPDINMAIVISRIVAGTAARKQRLSSWGSVLGFQLRGLRNKSWTANCAAV